MAQELLVKKDYLKELIPPSQVLKNGVQSADVKRLQEWLVYWLFVEKSQQPVLKFDGIFGPVTEKILKHVQKFLTLEQTGVVDAAVWNVLVNPMRLAFLPDPENFETVNARMTFFASRHLQFCACELLEDNIGPWVRANMGGREGNGWYWCEGFATSILDQTYSSFGKKFTDYYPYTFLTEEMREKSRAKGLLADSATLRSGGYTPVPGDMLLLINTQKNRAHHTAVIYDVYGETGKIRVIGGNTNFVGSDNGVGVFLNDNDYMSEPIEVVKLVAP